MFDLFYNNFGSFSRGTPSGYDIILALGQSNLFFGANFNAGLDASDADVYQYRYNAPANTITTAQEPLDYRDTSGTAGAGYIGPSFHFAKDYWKPSVANGRKILICANAFGGQPMLYFMPTAAGGSVGGCGADLTTRGPLALAAGGVGSSYRMVLYHQGEGDYIAYGNVAQPGQINNFRMNSVILVDSTRSQFATPTLPWCFGRLAAYSIDSGQINYSTNGVNIDKILREMPNRIEYVGCADSQSPTSLGAADVHFTAAEQRLMGSERYPTAYQAAVANTKPLCRWPTYDISGDFAISNSNKTIAGGASSSWKTQWANGGRSAGKLYFEIKMTGAGTPVNVMYGICSSRQSYDTYLGNPAGNVASPKSAAIWFTQPNSVTGYTVANAVSIGTPSVNDVYGFAVDFSAGKAWVSKNNTWQASGDPAAGTNPWITGVAERTFPAVSMFVGATNVALLQADAADLTYSPPSGFSAWGA